MNNLTHLAGCDKSQFDASLERLKIHNTEKMTLKVLSDIKILTCNRKGKHTISSNN